MRGTRHHAHHGVPNHHAALFVTGQSWMLLVAHWWSPPGPVVGSGTWSEMRPRSSVSRRSLKWNVVSRWVRCRTPRRSQTRLAPPEPRVAGYGRSRGRACRSAESACVVSFAVAPNSA